MRRVLLLLPVAAALGLAPPALAKGPVTLEVSGASGKKTFRSSPHNPGRAHDELVWGLVNWTEHGFGSPVPLQPYYELRFKPDWTGVDPMYYVHGANVLRIGSSWAQPSPALTAALVRAVRGLEPWPRPRFTRVFVGKRTAANPVRYEELFLELPRADAPPLRAQRFAVAFSSPRKATPWTDRYMDVDYVPTANVLWREGEWLRPSAELVAVIERDAGVRPRVRPATFPWDTVAPGGIALALLAAAGGLVLRRVRRRPGVQPA